jgi:hypothetical protein
MGFIERAYIRAPVALGLCFILLGVTMPSAADAQAWPTKQVIRAVVPLTAGSAGCIKSSV